MTKRNISSILAVLLCVAITTTSFADTGSGGRRRNTAATSTESAETAFEVVYAAKGTKCNILRKGFTKTQVKLLYGAYAGSTVWVVAEAVKTN